MLLYRHICFHPLSIISASYKVIFSLYRFILCLNNLHKMRATIYGHWPLQTSHKYVMGRQTWRIDEDGKHTGGLARSVIEWFGTVQYWYIKEYINTYARTGHVYQAIKCIYRTRHLWVNSYMRMYSVQGKHDSMKAPWFKRVLIQKTSPNSTNKLRAGLHNRQYTGV